MGKYNRHAVAVLGAPALLGILFAAPALATDSEGKDCAATSLTDLTGVVAETRIAGQKPGVAKLTGAGLRVKTPDAGSKVHAYFDIEPVKAKKVDGLKFKSIKNESVTVVAPSYQLGIDLNGNGAWDASTDAIAVWEAYQNGHNPPLAEEPVEYDAWEVGAAKYWFTKPIPGLAPGAGTQATPVPFGDFATAQPDLKILFFGLNQGSGNAGADTTWINVRFKAGKDCTLYKWKKPDPSESPTASPTVAPTTTPTVEPTETVSPSTTPTPTESSSPSASPSPSDATVTSSPESGGGSSLPVTGVKLAGLVLGAATLLGLGMFLVVVARRRRTV